MAAERAVSLRASADLVCTEVGRMGRATFAHPERGVTLPKLPHLSPPVPSQMGLGSGHFELQGRDDVLSKTQEKDSEPQSFEGPTWSLTFLREILSWGVASMPAYYARGLLSPAPPHLDRTWGPCPGLRGWCSCLSHSKNSFCSCLAL